MRRADEDRGHAPAIPGLGDVLRALFPDGPQFGGAPADVARQAAMLGADTFAVTRLVDDELCERATAAFTRQL
jgi:sugar/nucleoside kinase (ribokinase family)